MNPEQIAALAGVLLSLALEYFPFFSDWYNGQDDNVQKLIVLASGLVVVAGTFGLGCAALIASPWPCDGPGVWQAVLAFVAFVLASQGTYLVLPKK